MSVIDFIKQATGIHKTTIKNFVKTAPHRYKKYQILKRDGIGKRDIAQPSKELKVIQKYICENYSLISSLPVHSSAKAYRTGVGIKDNAECHKNSRYLLKMDFANFFPSVQSSDLAAHLRVHSKQKLDEEELENLSRLFFYSKSRKDKSLVLSIGAPSSPFISNSIMHEFDCIVSEFCTDNNVIYTRYADDLTFSTNTKGFLFNVPKKVEEVLSSLSYPKLEINHKKTVFLSKAYNRHVTGLVISNDGGISIGRKKKRYIKSLVFQYINGQLEEQQTAYLRGYLSFLKGIDLEFIRSIEKKYEINTSDI